MTRTAVLVMLVVACVDSPEARPTTDAGANSHDPALELWIAVELEGSGEVAGRIAVTDCREGAQIAFVACYSDDRGALECLELGRPHNVGVAVELVTVAVELEGAPFFEWNLLGSTLRAMPDRQRWIMRDPEAPENVRCDFLWER